MARPVVVVWILLLLTRKNINTVSSVQHTAAHANESCACQSGIKNEVFILSLRLFYWSNLG